MEVLHRYVQRFAGYTKFVSKEINLISNIHPILPIVLNRSIHVTNIDRFKNVEDFRWMKYNNKIYPPQESHEERRPAFICHMKSNIKYSPKNMWYISSFIRGMSVDEAVKQLSFVPKKGAAFVKDTILEAQELAVKDHNVEFKSNLWIAESFSVQGVVFHGMRRHARMRVGKISYRHSHYFVRLEEGKPPKHYYMPVPLSPEELLEQWKDQLRMRKIPNSL